MKKKVAVTGSKGFIGSHLTKRLLKDGYDVVEIDLKIGSDIRTIDSKWFKGCDTVFHLAAQAKVPLSIEDPYFTHDHNINGTLNVLKCSKEAGVRRVVYSASSSAYGEQASMPLTEDMTPNPMSPYGTQKLVGEYYAKNFADLYGLETVCLRYFNVYGENMPIDGAYSACIAHFIDKYRKGKALEVFGGQQKRDFTYVGDVVEANILASMSNKVGKGETINIGTGENISIEELAKLFNSVISYLPQRTGEPMETRADISRAKELLGWSPKMDIRTWIRSIL